MMSTLCQQEVAHFQLTKVAHFQLTKVAHFQLTKVAQIRVALTSGSDRPLPDPDRFLPRLR